MTCEKASSACSSEPYRSYRIPIPYQSFGSCINYALAVVLRHCAGGTHLWIWHMIEGLLVGRICLLEVIDHQIAVAFCDVSGAEM